MRIYVLAECMLAKFEPKKPTIALRIFSSKVKSSGSERIPLTHPNYIKEFRYYFDDIDTVIYPECNNPSFLRNYTLFNDNISKTMLKDFQSVYSPKKNQDLMVHCLHGLSRSPAVAIALNSIFRLDNNHLPMEYFMFNRHVHNQLLTTARESGIVF